MAKDHADSLKQFVLQMAMKDKKTLGSVRTMPGLLMAEEDEIIWLRGQAGGVLPMEIRQLPALKTFLLDEKGLLFPAGHLTPSGRIKHMQWKSLTETLPAELPVSLLPGKVDALLPISLSPSNEEQEGVALLTTIDVLKVYAETAPEVRLKRTMFAVSGSGQTLVYGTPLLPLPGKVFWKKDRLLLPLGFDFAPPALFPLISEKFAGSEAFILFHPDGSWERIHHEQLVATSRSAVRLTKREGSNA
jgi:hypothetical protein